MPDSVAPEAEREITRDSKGEPVSTQPQTSHAQSPRLNGTARATTVKNSDALQQQLTALPASSSPGNNSPLSLGNGLVSSLMGDGGPGRVSPAESLKNGEPVRPVTPSSMALRGSRKSSGPTDSIAIGQTDHADLKSTESISYRMGNTSGSSGAALSAGIQDAAPQLPPMGTSTPPGRRSVQFARPVFSADQLDSPYLQRASWEGDELESPVKERGKQSGIFHKLQKAFSGATGLQTHGRSQSGFTIGSSIDETPSGPLSPASASERGDFAYPTTLEEEDATDADAEESAGDDTGANPGRALGKRAYRPTSEGTRTEPTTPQSKAA